jgi:hypothetical protein
VLNRHESLASNLGAKLTGPRLLKAMEGVFEGPIVTNPPQPIFIPNPVTWLDIVEFAKANPSDFVLTTLPNGLRSCQFPLKGVQVEISEDDWRLIVSGALDRFRLVPPQPLEEDETTELATLDILEKRLQVLIKRADEVARKARQLNYHLSGRKATIGSRRSQPGAGFQAVNQPRAAGANPGYDLHADLLQQFLAPGQPSNQRLSSFGSVPATPNPATTAASTPRMSVHHHTIMPSSRPSPSYPVEIPMADREEENRALVVRKIETVARGEIIQPPCDRCRRLKMQCIKHLTACQGCTRKHCKCAWKFLTEEEMGWLRGEIGGPSEDDDDTRDAESNYGSVSHMDTGDTRLTMSLDDSTAGRSQSRIAVGRHADDIWRKGPDRSATSRRDSLDMESRDSGQAGHAHTHFSHGSTSPQMPEATFDERSRLSRMASVATAAADAAAASRP